ncbi:MAG: SPOR domain-containing protein [Planktomarina sp.]
MATAPLQATIVTSLILTLGACTLGDTPEFLAPSTRVTPSASTEVVARDVEAPEAFQVTEKGLWDGRPSLGGIWVAHPTARDPERVIIRNPANGKFVVGALFRKEGDLPGPALQVSSDAAAAIGLIAGQPQVLNVTALRSKDVPANAAPAPSASPAPLGVETIAIETPAPAAVPSASAPSKPFIQVAIFSVQSNANETAGRLNSAGIAASVKRFTAGDKTLWKVVAGPANSDQSRDDLLTRVKAQGFSDAYAVKG